MQPNDAQLFARFLVPLDGSTLAEQALPYAQAIGGDKAAFLLVAVVPPAEPQRDVAGRLIAIVDEIYERAERTAREGLLRSARRWLGDRDEIDLEVVIGDPAEEIIRLATDRDADLIVLAGHGRGAVGRLAFGSVADRIAHASPVPVMIVRPQDAPAEIGPLLLTRVVVPLDGSALAARALPVAQSLARRLGVSMALVRAIDPAQLVGPFGEAAVLPPTFFVEEEAAARRSLEAAADALRAAGVTTTTEVRTGLPFAVIAETARPGDIVVLTSHGRSGVRRWLLGSVAEKLVRHGPVPVVVVPVGEPEVEEGAAHARELATVAPR